MEALLTFEEEEEKEDSQKIPIIFYEAMSDIFKIKIANLVDPQDSHSV